jgi:hypothetical protein
MSNRIGGMRAVADITTGQELANVQLAPEDPEKNVILPLQGAMLDLASSETGSANRTETHLLAGLIRPEPRKRFFMI